MNHLHTNTCESGKFRHNGKKESLNIYSNSNWNEFMHTNQLKHFLSPSWNENNRYIVTSQSAQMCMWLDVRSFDSPLLSAHVKLIKQLTMWRFTFSFSRSTFRPPSCIPKRFVIILKFNRSANIKWIGHNFTPQTDHCSHAIEFAHR